MIQEAILRDLYFNKKLSMKEISEHLQCSQNKVSYWMKCHNVTRRTIAEGVYIKKNPNGDPFSFSKPEIEKNSFYLVSVLVCIGEKEQKQTDTL